MVDILFVNPGDVKESNCEFANFYCAMTYPGSQIYNIALKERLELPKEWKGYSLDSYIAIENIKC